MVIVQCFLEPSFGMAFIIHFCCFGLSFGIPFGDNFNHLLGTIFALICRPPKQIETGGGAGEAPWLQSVRSPLLGLLPPS